MNIPPRRAKDAAQRHGKVENREPLQVWLATAVATAKVFAHKIKQRIEHEDVRGDDESLRVVVVDNEPDIVQPERNRKDAEFLPLPGDFGITIDQSRHERPRHEQGKSPEPQA